MSKLNPVIIIPRKTKRKQMFTNKEINEIAKIVKKINIHSGDKIVFKTTDTELVCLNEKRVYCC